MGRSIYRPPLTAMHCTKLPCTVLHYTAIESLLFQVELQETAPDYCRRGSAVSSLVFQVQYGAVQYGTVMKCSAVKYGVVQGSAVQYSRGAVQYGALKYCAVQ